MYTSFHLTAFSSAMETFILFPVHPCVLVAHMQVGFTPVLLLTTVIAFLDLHLNWVCRSDMGIILHMRRVENV